PGNWIHTPGYVALMGFFAMSGYQISESWAADPTWWRYLAKRVLRIWPPLLFVVLVCALVIGPLVTVVSSHDYWSSRLTWSYVLNNATLYNVAHLLPGVFLHNPYPWSVNGSLWTLPMEFTGYLVVLVFGLVAFVRHSKAMLFPLLVGLMVADGMFGSGVGFGGTAGSILHTPIGSLCSFMVAFVVGMILFSYRDRIPLHGVAALVLLVVYAAVYVTPAARFALPLMAGYGSIVLAHRWPKPFARHDRWVYCSYGLYVWAFPIQQLVVLAGLREEWLVAAASVPLAYTAGLFSWHVIERPTQRLRYYLRRPAKRASVEPEPPPARPEPPARWAPVPRPVPPAAQGPVPRGIARHPPSPAEETVVLPRVPQSPPTQGLFVFRGSLDD
ncbi:MAG: acyltransferase family protein, partial [Sciscionella sp.]